MGLEAKVKNRIREYLDSVPRCYHMAVITGGMGRVGTLDRYVCHEGRFIGIEVKGAPKDEPTPPQRRTLFRIEQAGGTAFLLDCDNWEIIKEYVR